MGFASILTNSVLQSPTRSHTIDEKPARYSVGEDRETSQVDNGNNQ